MLIAVLCGVVLVLGAVGLGLLLSSKMAVPKVVPPTVPLTPEPQPEPITVQPQPEPTTAQPTQPETVFVTLTPSPAPQESSGVEPSATAGALTIETLTTDSAAAFMNDYLRRVVASPDDGWALLSTRRQQIENRAAYFAYWPTLSAASVSGCGYQSTGSLTCTLTTVDRAGKTGSAGTRFWLTVENGQLRIDVAGGGGPEQLAAEQELERLRRESVAGLVHDDRWVVELSAKRPGIADPLQTAANGTHVFYLPDILAMHEGLRARFPGTRVLMLRTADWGKQGRDLWFTVADPGGLTSEADAAAWCAAKFPELAGKQLANQCTPRRMTAPRS